MNSASAWCAILKSPWASVKVLQIFTRIIHYTKIEIGMINCRNYFTYESRDKRIAVNGCGHINKSPPHKHKYFLSTGDPMINCILHQLFNDSCLDAQFFRNCSQFVARLKILLIQPTIYEVCHNLSIWNEVTVNLSDTEI